MIKTMDYTDIIDQYTKTSIARNSVQDITTFTIDASKLTQHEIDIITHAITAFGFLLASGDYTWREFSKEIADSYDTDTPQTACIVVLLANLDHRQ